MSNADELRAICLEAMAAHKAIEPRGFDTIAKRADLHRQVDEILDDWFLESLVEHIAPLSA